jgi:hypothetical protein
MQVETLTKYIDKKQKTVDEILTMFLNFFFEILSKNENFEILEENNLNALLCISTALYH